MTSRYQSTTIRESTIGSGSILFALANLVASQNEMEEQGPISNGQFNVLMSFAVAALSAFGVIVHIL